MRIWFRFHCCSVIMAIQPKMPVKYIIHGLTLKHLKRTMAGSVALVPSLKRRFMTQDFHVTNFLTGGPTLKCLKHPITKLRKKRSN